MKIALITEGPSEYRIIKHIIGKYFKNSAIEINQIQPKLINGKQDQNTPGGWNEVLKYCQRPELKDILVENDFIVIQIDTDQSQISPFNISHTHNNSKVKTPDELCIEVIEKLKGLLIDEIRHSSENKIVFAICIHTIECWLLPIYYTNIHSKKNVNCITLLNSAFQKQKISVLTASNKNKPNGIKSYESALKNWAKKKDIIDSSQHNSGFKKFVDA